MNNDVLKITFRFIGLLVLQIFLMDQINFLGYINPMIYILFIFLYPFDNNRLLFLILAFLLGLVMDTFQDTGGAHAAACVTLTFVRPYLLKLVYGESYVMKNIKVLTTGVDRILLLLCLCVVIHHLVFYSLMLFNMSQILELLKMTLSVGMATIIVSFTFLLLIKPRRS
jgi:cell shape-determining protein MreD